jgi:hypothetical protein
MSDEQVVPDTEAVALAALRHSVRIAVHEDRAAKAAKAAEDARIQAAADFAVLRDKGVKQIGVAVPGSTQDAGLISIYGGQREIHVEEDLLILCVRPAELETYAVVAALRDERVVKLLDVHFPEYVERRIKPAVRAELQVELEDHDGVVTNRTNGEKEQVATITRHPATGKCQYRPGKLAGELLRAAIDAGLLSEDGEIPGLRDESIANAPVPADDIPNPVPLFADEDGFFDPEKAAAFVMVASLGKGFTTPPIEAYRMIRDGGTNAERARVWLTAHGLDPADPRQGKDTPWPLAPPETAAEPEPEAVSQPAPEPIPAAKRALAVPTPTAEQAAIIDAYSRGGNLVVNAFAGSGKTTILRLLAAASPALRFQYVAYNAAAKKDAAASFPKNATCSTSHGLAFRPMIHMAQRIGGPKYVPGIQLAKLMKITGPARLTKDRMLAPGQIASVVKATIARFCYSADEQIGKRHVPRDLKRFTAPDEIAALQEIIPPIARRVWERDIITDSGVVPMEHDYYLKAYALTHPRLPGQVIALDEAQDSNPCVARMILEQAQHGTQIIMVGDTYQAIYGWRGAVDAMSDFARQPGVTVLPLTQSFRFGPEIAAEGNKWLQILGAPHQLRGFEKIASRIGRVSGNGDAVLCRTNAEALKRAIAAMASGLKVAFPKGAGDLIALTKGAADIKAGRPSEHQDLMPFATWGQVQDFAENEPGGADLKLFVDLVDEHGTDELLDILSRIGSEEKGAKADLTISTAHMAKGREWAMVEIAGDFLEPRRDPDTPPGQLPEIPREMAMLAYVAVTRAKHVLDREGLAWVDRYLPDLPAQERAA